MVGPVVCRDPDTAKNLDASVVKAIWAAERQGQHPTGDVKPRRGRMTPPPKPQGRGPGARRRRALAERKFDAETTHHRRRRQPGPWNTWARTSKDGNPHDFDSLYTSGQVGVDPSTGEVKWFYQHTPNDAWDFSGNNELVLFDYKDKDGKVVKATGHADRNGFFYVLDRNNGKLQNAFPFVDNITWASNIDLKTGRPVENEGQRPAKPLQGETTGSGGSSPPSLVAKNGTPWPTARTRLCATSGATGKRNTGRRGNYMKARDWHGLRQGMYDDHSHPACAEPATAGCGNTRKPCRWAACCDKGTGVHGTGDVS